MTLVHATPHQPKAWDYIFSLQEASLSFHHFDHQICFIGHSHRPITFVKDEKMRISTLMYPSFTLSESRRYIINVGSVGQPRDGDPRAAYGIYHTDDGRFTLKRIPYNIECTQKKMMEAGLPPFLASRLASGS